MAVTKRSMTARDGEPKRLDRLERELAGLKAVVRQLRDRRSLVVPITTFEPEPFEVVRDILVVVRPNRSGFDATFFDANIAISGDTQEEALSNLRQLIVDMYETLEEDEGSLGPEPARQLAVLKSVMRKRS